MIALDEAKWPSRTAVVLPDSVVYDIDRSLGIDRNVNEDNDVGLSGSSADAALQGRQPEANAEDIETPEQENGPASDGDGEDDVDMTTMGPALTARMLES